MTATTPEVFATTAPQKASSFWVTRALTAHYVADAFRGRLVLVLALTWAATLVAGIWANGMRETQLANRMRTERQALDSYYAQVPNTVLLWQQFYTVLRPRPPLAALVSGVEHNVPGQLDYRPRFSPSFYYGDDLDPLTRFFPSPDLVTTVGIAGLIIALLLCFDAVNGEIDSNNVRILMMHGASVTQIYLAKVASHLFVLGLAFTVAFATGACAFLLGAPAGVAAGRAGQLLAMYGACLLYLVFAVIAFTSISAVLRRPGTSFFAGVGVFVLIVYVLPFLVELTATQVKPLTHDHQDLMQEKVIFSREAHSKADPVLAKANFAFKGAPPDSAVLGKNLYAFTSVMQEFSVINSEESMRQDGEYLRELEAHTDRVAAVSTWASPYFAFESALSVIADTGLGNERLLLEEATVTRFKAYRDWWIARTQNPPLWGTMPVDKWLFAPDATPVDLSAFRDFTYPELSWSQKRSLLVMPIAALVFASVVFFLAGYAGAQRFRRGL